MAVETTLTHRHKVAVMYLSTAQRHLTLVALTQAAVATRGTTAALQVVTTVGNPLSFKPLRILTNKFGHSRYTCIDGLVGSRIAKPDMLPLIRYTGPKVDVRQHGNACLIEQALAKLF